MLITQRCLVQFQEGVPYAELTQLGECIPYKDKIQSFELCDIGSIPIRDTIYTISSVGRTLVLQTRGHRVGTCIVYQMGIGTALGWSSVLQTENQMGSIPIISTSGLSSNGKIQDCGS